MASSRDWFESVAEAQRRAKKRLPHSVYYALVAGSEQGITLTDNITAFSELGLRPRLGGRSSHRDLSTTLLGEEIPFPVIISPTGVQAVHPEAEVAVARAAAAKGTIMSLSSFGTKPIEEVVAANPRTFFQLYWIGGRDEMLQHITRAKRAGAIGLILTLDWSFDTRRDWGSPAIPEKLDLKTLIQFAPQGLANPGWTLQFLRSGGLPDLTVPNVALPDQPAPRFFGAYGKWMQTPPPSWDDVAWLRKEWGGHFIVKGVMRPDDARRAIDIGADAISVSNHGGNTLDGTPATIRSLPAIAEAVNGQIEVLLDGGIRRGSDVVKALALGARAVMIGRAYLWGLTANGQAGVQNVLDILREGIDSTLLGLGRTSVHDLSPDDLLIPADFAPGTPPALARQRAERSTTAPEPT